MNRSINTIKSKNLGKDMTVIAYGDAKAYPVIAFPTQDQMADEWEKNGMLDVLAEYIDAGRIQLFTVDSNDLESWSSASTDFAARAQRQEDYFNFVIDELLPFVHKSNGTQLRPLATGCSLGATQAAIVALRRPDVIQGAIALSGMFHTSYFFGNWGNEVSYNNDVNGFLPNMPLDHPYIQMYKNRTFAFSIGQAADEQFGVDDLHFLQATFRVQPRLVLVEAADVQVPARGREGGRGHRRRRAARPGCREEAGCQACRKARRQEGARDRCGQDRGKEACSQEARGHGGEGRAQGNCRQGNCRQGNRS